MKLPALSHTLLNTYLICPHQMMRRYIAKDLPKEEKSKEQLDGINVHEAIERRVRNKTPLPAELARHEPLVAPLDNVRVEPELELAVTAAGRPCGFWDGAAWLRGKLDAPILLRTDRAVLADWKSGKRREDPFELEIGAVLLQARRPEINQLYGVYIWLREGVRGQPHDLSDTARTWQRVQEIAHEIETAKEFKKTPGPLCGWCPVMDCQHNRREK